MLTINNTLDGYLKDVEIKGNTVQDPDNLADIRSVGDKVEGQELYEIPVLSCGKNLFNMDNISSNIISKSDDTYEIHTQTPVNLYNKSIFKAVKNVQYTVSYKAKLGTATNFRADFVYTDGSYQQFSYCNSTTEFIQITKTSDKNKQLDYVRFNWTNSGTIYIKDIQVEEGTVATPYEPYVEDKLTILSLVQLEKVGDVRDRIVCKDGVWGVEKNVITKLFDGSENNVTGVSLDGNGLNYRLCYSRKKVLDNVADSSKLMSNKFECFVYSSSTNNVTVPSFRFIYTNSELYCVVPATEFTEHPSTQAFKEKVASYGTYIKYPTTQPQFIPLPHDQQVKLRTFASKTNISFGCEIEGTIKAQVPKSLGATVNTHTEQINNLNKELDRVKKLEESTVSTVTTESNFTTVEATSNGYFEDVKLEGKTLVNLVKTFSDNGVSGWLQLGNLVYDITDKTITICNLSDKNIKFQTSKLDNSYDNQIIIKPFSSVAITLNNIKFRMVQGAYSDGWSSEKLDEFKKAVLILEGDHTQNPPAYFKGLKSVGQDVAEVSVLTSKDNLVNYLDKSTLINNGVLVGEYLKQTSANLTASAQYNVVRGKEYTFAFDIYSDVPAGNLAYCLSYSKSYGSASNSNHISIGIGSMSKRVVINFTAKEECVYLILGTTTNITVKDISLNLGNTDGTYTLPKQDKKRLLYYNEETQTWEKPVLREWDSIEKHTDGKYYYHQRSGEVVLNGSEEIGIYSESDSNDVMAFTIRIKNNSVAGCICDRFMYKQAYGLNANYENIFNPNDSYLQIRILKSKLSTQDAQGFKQWLQANNVTVVYQLAQEEVYECTNIDLITYANETNFIVESGVLSPRTTLKVHSNISNVVSLLQKKVSLLEGNVTSYMTTQNRLMLASRYNSDTVSFKVDYAVYSENMSQENYDTDLYNLILNNILVGKDNYDYDHMFNIIMDYASWSQISWDQFDILVGLMDIQHNPPIEKIPTDDEIVEEIPNEIM